VNQARFLPIVVLLVAIPVRIASAQEAAGFFQQKCKACHTIGGGRLVGPDLKDVTKRKDRAWLEHFMQDPKAVIDSGDPYALQLKQEAREMVMPTLPGVTPQMARSLLDMIEQESEPTASAPAKPAGAAAQPASASAQATSPPPASQVSPAPSAPVHPPSGSVQQAADFFQQNCKACHTIGGGRLVGPDLKGATQRKDRAWLENFVQNPKAVIDSGDPYALQLRQDARGIVMPTIPGLTQQLAKQLVDLIEEQSEHSKSGFGGTAISDRPFTAADVSLGAEIFRGKRKLRRGGPACISCHTLGTLGWLGGGRLGPDLTRAYERLGGRKAVAAWLAAPATPTMQAVFRGSALQDEEILPLLAVFENASQNSLPADSTSQVDFLFAGFAGLSGALALMGWVWRKRFRSVRRTMVGIARGDE
jgi:cytochrome c2